MNVFLFLGDVVFLHFCKMIEYNHAGSLQLHFAITGKVSALYGHIYNDQPVSPGIIILEFLLVTIIFLNTF